MERPFGAHSYRYGPGARQRKDLEYGLLEAVFEDRAALEAAMDEFLGRIHCADEHETRVLR